MKTVSISIAATLIAGSLFFTSCSASSLSSSSSSSGTSSSAASSSSSKSDSPLAVAKVQKAVDKALDWTRKGGTASILGVQELPQENAAKADIRFDGFKYATDYYGQPVSAAKQVKPIPKDRLPTPDELFGQPKVDSFSGKGEGILKHYSDGRWVLTEVHFNLVGVSANIDLQ